MKKRSCPIIIIIVIISSIIIINGKCYAICSRIIILTLFLLSLIPTIACLPRTGSVQTTLCYSLFPLSHTHTHTCDIFHLPYPLGSDVRHTGNSFPLLQKKVRGSC